MAKLWIIARTTFSEIIRQPFYFVIIAIAGGLTAASPTFTAFTLLNNEKLMKEMGLATMLLAAWFLSAVAAARVVSIEIETKTVMTLLSKPVSRAQFLIGKFLGIVGAVGLACAILGAILMMIARVGVKEAAYTHLDIPLLWTMIGVLAGSVALGGLLNYLFNQPFTSTTIKLLVVLLWLAVLVFAFLDKQGRPVEMATSLDRAFMIALAVAAVISGVVGVLAWQLKRNIVPSVLMSFVLLLNLLVVVFLVLHNVEIGTMVKPDQQMSEFVVPGMPVGVFLFRFFDAQLFQAILIGMLGALVLSSVALMCSTRLSLVSTAVASLVVYSLGLVSDNLVARLPERGISPAMNVFREVGRRAYMVVPNFQHFRVGDALMDDRFVPPAYLGWTTGYAVVLMLMFLFLAMALFQQREVG